MIRFNPRWPVQLARPSRSTLAAAVCVAVALLSFLALVAYESTDYTAFWN